MTRRLRDLRVPVVLEIADAASGSTVVHLSKPKEIVVAGSTIDP